MSAPFLTIDGERVDVSGVPLNQSLLEFLRLSGRTASKEGCNEGDCGACTVVLLEHDAPPRAINSCLALVGSLVGRSVLTSEGLRSEDGALHPAAQAMVDGNGSQCGYCTPGFVCSMAEAAARGVSDDPAAVADQLCGNLCRCTGYRPIREAMAATPETALPSPDAESSIDLPGYHRPTSLADALALRAAHPGAEFIAGATELAVLINKRHVRHTELISLEHVAELCVIEESECAWTVGAAVPLTDIEAALGDEIPAFSQMLRLFASRQIRHRATLGGNLVTASPIGDSPPVLLALDAEVVLASVEGERSVMLADFFTAYRQTVMRDDELMVAVRIPRGLDGRCEFFKVSKRREMDISTVSAAFRIATDDAGVVTEARLAYGGVAATPARAIAAEEALVGKSLDGDLSDVFEELGAAYSPMSDQRAGAEFRETLILELFRKFLSGCGQDEIAEPVLGTSFTGGDGPPHESAIGHVTGEVLYTHDIALKRGALAVWPVFSTTARGKFTPIDSTAALASPGVRDVLTAADVPGENNTGPARHDEPLFADGEICFHGQLIAAVIADSEEEARVAAELLQIEVEPLPPLLGIEAAIKAESFHTDPHVLARGDIEAGISGATHTLEGSLRVGGQEQFYLESHTALAEPDGEGGIHITSSTQHPSETQTIVAEVMGWARHRIVVECPRMGGGFGGKETQANPWAALCAIAADRTGCAVGLQLDRDHDITVSGKRHPFLAQFRIGYDDDGMLQAAEVQLYSDGGWSLDLSLPVNDRALFHLDNAYYIPHVRFRGQVCKTNTTSHTAFRGFGGPQGMIVIEDILGRIASELGLPPEDVRRRNLYHGEGETNTTHYGEVVDDNRLGRIWDGLMDSSEFAVRRAAIDEWNAGHPERKRGLAITPVKFGISFTLKHYNQAGALVLVYADGSVQVNHGGTEMGQGLHSKIHAVAMRELGLPAAAIRLMHTRTDKVPNTSATAASSGSDLNGMAVADACAQIRARLAPLAAEMLGCAEDEIEFSQGEVRGGDESIPFNELVAKAYTERIQLSAAGFYKTPDLKWDWSEENPKGRPFHYYAFGAAVSEVEVDGFTGMHHLRRVDILHDVGDSLNPSIDRGQIEGGFVQGQGWLTAEDLLWKEDGTLLTHSASTYAIPSFSDAPIDFRVALLEDAAQARTIGGSKAVGEPPLMLAISVREALRDALSAFGNTEPIDSPLTAERLKSHIGPLSSPPVPSSTSHLL